MALTSLYKNEFQINESLRDRFLIIKKELSSKGVLLEMKVATTKNAYEKISHDRFIIGENVKYNVPSYTTVVHGGFSEIKKTGNIIPFEEYWSNNECLDMVNDWTQIRKIADGTKRSFDAKCSSCGKEIFLPFRPDGVRPVYCRQCMPS